MVQNKLWRVYIKQAFAIGLQAANAIAKYGLNGLISIREIGFNANLDVAAGGSLSGSVRACSLCRSRWDNCLY